tara:strand:- start:356 stop:736 length:381 start_codon:yes stop_codon:yes gene_type:complete
MNIAQESSEEIYGRPVSREYLGRLSVLENRIGAVEAFLGTADAPRVARAAHVGVYWASETASTLQAEVSSSKHNHYGVLMLFGVNGLTARCECPDTNPVCKHLIAVGQRFVKTRKAELESGDLSGL